MIVIDPSAANPLDAYLVDPHNGLAPTIGGNVIATEWEPGDTWELTLPHAFNFCGETITKVTVAGNGYLYLGSVNYPPAPPSLGIIDHESQLLFARGGARYIAPWWQDQRGLAFGTSITWSVNEPNGYVEITWKGIHADDNELSYKMRTFGVRLYWKATVGVHDQPGAIYFLYAQSFGIVGSPGDPADAAVGVANGLSYRTPHNELDGSDATHPLGGHDDNGNSELSTIAGEWPGVVAGTGGQGYYVYQPDGTEALIRAWPTGTHTIVAVSPLGFDPGMNAATWGMAYKERPDGSDHPTQGPPPHVVRMTDRGMGEVVLDLDAALIPNRLYWLYPPTVNGSLLAPSIEIKGLLIAPDRTSPSGDRMLLDFDAPIFGPNGHGSWTVKGGDYVLTGGDETIIKAVWSLILERKGERYWDRDRGSEIDYQGPIPSDEELRENEKILATTIEREIPFVLGASVSYTVENNDHLILTWRVKLDSGIVTDRRRVNAAS